MIEQYSTVRKATRKPMTLNFIEWTGDNQKEVFNFLTNNKWSNNPMVAIWENFFIDHCLVLGGLVIKTLEGQHIASVGDMIMQGVTGEFYPCKPAIFPLIYDVHE